jgi:hypothetical protein
MKNLIFLSHTKLLLSVLFLKIFVMEKKHFPFLSLSLSLSLSLCLAKLALSVGEREMNLNVTF